MRILGIGTDIIEIERIKKAGESNPGFLDRVLSKREKDYCFNIASRYQSVAGRFAGKEAVVKALGTGFAACSFSDIEIVNNTKGKPEVILANNALKLFEEMGGQELQISISHSKETAVAFVVIQG